MSGCEMGIGVSMMGSDDSTRHNGEILVRFDSAEVFALLMKLLYATSRSDPWSNNEITMFLYRNQCTAITHGGKAQPLPSETSSPPPSYGSTSSFQKITQTK